MMRYLLLLLLFSSIIACADDRPKGIKHSKCNHATVWKGDMTITDTFKIEEGHCLVIEPGSNITFEPGALILAFGNLFIEGTNGKVLVENCTFNWNNQGEGLLLHKVMEPLVRNCTFNQLPDAIEYIHCKKGIIRGNSFNGCGDDAVDQNHCQFTLIENNEFYNIKDRALELGSEKFGRSDSLKVINNLFVGCKVAINVKESSNAWISNCTFYQNDIALDVHTLKDSTISSVAVMLNSVISQSRMPVSANDRAITKINNSMTDIPSKKAPSVPVIAVAFKDPDNKDFRIVSKSFPSDLDANTMGYQKK